MNLDDVIEALNCFTLTIDCEKCPYYEYHDVMGGTGDGLVCLEMLSKDAASYLLQYKSTLKQMEQVEQIRADAVRQKRTSSRRSKN